MRGRDLGGKERELKAALGRLDELGVSLGEKAGIMSELGLETETTQDVVQDTER